MDCFPMPCHYQSICMALLDFRLQCLFTSIPRSFWRIRHVTFVCQLDPHNNNIMYPNACSGLTIAQQQLFITGSPNLILLSRSSNSSRLKRAKDLLPGWHQWFSAAISDATFWYQQETIPKIIKNIYIYIYQTWLKSGLFATFPTCLAPTFDVMRNVSSIFRDVFSDVRCPGYGQVVSWGSPAAPAAVRWSTWSSAPGGRWGSPPWRHLAPECATWRLAMVLIFHDESNKSNKSNEPRYTKMLLHEKNVASC